MDTYKTIAWELGLPTERSRAALFRQLRQEVTRLVIEARCRPIVVSTRRSISEATCWKTSGCSPTTKWIPKTGLTAFHRSS